jgi:hypothetical protein
MKKPKFPDCYVKFLPSEEGTGFTSTIRADLGYTKQGWKNWYSHLKGVAKDFDPDNEWEAIVRHRLQEQGVRFE